MRGARLAGRPSRSRARDTGTRAIVGPIERDTFRHRQVPSPRPRPTSRADVRTWSDPRVSPREGGVRGRRGRGSCDPAGCERVWRHANGRRDFKHLSNTRKHEAVRACDRHDRRWSRVPRILQSHWASRNESKSERLRRRSRRWYVQRRLIYESSDGRRVSPGSGARERTLRASDGGCADRRTRTRAALDARGERARRHATRLLSSRRSVSLFVIRAHLSRRARSSAHRRRRIEAARCYVSSSVWILDEHVAVTESASSASERFRELQRF